METIVGPEPIKEKRASSSLTRRKLADYIATIVVSTGGVAVILSIIAILFFIGWEVLPLWQGVKSELASSFVLKEDPELSSYSIDTPQKSEFPFIVVGSEEYREIGFTLSDHGKVRFMSLETGDTVKEFELTGLDGARITSDFVAINNQLYVAGTDVGSILPFRVNYQINFDAQGKREIIPSVTEKDPITISDSKLNIVAYEINEEGSNTAAAAYTSAGELLFMGSGETESFLGDTETVEHKHELTSVIQGSSATTIEIDNILENLYVGAENGKIYHWDISNIEEPEFIEAIDATDGKGSAVTALGFLLGDRSLIVGDSDGNVSVWFQVNDPTSPLGFRLQKVHSLDPLELPVTKIVASPRDRGLIASDKGGNINLYHATSNQTLLSLKDNDSSIMALNFSPKANGIIAIDNNANLINWQIHNPHPETTFKTLFGKVWYEGYSKPEYVWQSTGGTDEFEPKLSLTPLAYGTFKGAIYALLIALPLSIFGAICVSQFMHPTFRNVIKPVIEIMAALPSVVLGFFAGLWLAPHIEKIIPAVFALPVVLTVMTLLSVLIWQKMPRSIKGRFKTGTELFLLVPVIILAVLISLGLNTPLDNALFGGDYKNWLYTVLGLQYDQRNALIVGFAMGFAVIPIIFTISEDALSSVPKHLTAGSLALGATKWQTAIKVVLPTASPGIFSAVMIGFGRAVGETMIVLMATGNTPIMDWSIFNGFRALSANIAVEIPEAPHGGTLYRVLFLAGLLLFLFTFVINTGAEIVRQRLRKKYGQL